MLHKINTNYFLSFLFFSSITFAQNENLIEEVIVTATKTEKTLQEVPVAVSVVSGDTIEKANIIDILDLKAVVPSLDLSLIHISEPTRH